MPDADRIELLIAPTDADPAARYGAVPRHPDLRLKALLKAALRQHGFRVVRMRNVRADLPTEATTPAGGEIGPPERRQAAKNPRRPPGRLC